MRGESPRRREKDGDIRWIKERPPAFLFFLFFDKVFLLVKWLVAEDGGSIRLQVGLSRFAPLGPCA